MVFIRNANETDLTDITLLMSELGYEANESEIAKRLSKLTSNLSYACCGN